jgi:hypothetical protein
VVLNNNTDGHGYELAYKVAWQQLASIDDIEQQCLKSDAQYQIIDSKRVITTTYLNQSYLVSLSDRGISLKGSEELIPLRDKILIIHYLAQAKGTPLSNKAISYKELSEGANYFPTFSKRTIKPFVERFGKEPVRLVDVATKVGGYKADYGDIAVTINAFPRIPITFVLWQGDDEFPPEGNILFDSNINDYLPIEDIIVLCEAIVWKLVKSH